MKECPRCGNELSWQNDYDNEDVGGIPGILSCWDCLDCGVSVDILYPVEPDDEEEVTEDE